MPCPANYNPADFYIHSLAVVPGHEVESRKKIKAICDVFETSDGGQLVLQQVKSNRSLNSSQSQGLDLAPVEVKRSPYKASWFAQFRAVLWRSALTVLREPSILRAKGFQAIVWKFIYRF